MADITEEELDLVMLDEMVRTHFYGGPMGGATRRLSEAINAVIQPVRARQCAVIETLRSERDAAIKTSDEWQEIARAREALSERRARKLDEERAMVDHWSRIAADRLVSANRQLERARTAEAERDSARSSLDEAREALTYTVGLLPGLAGAENQPDNAVYTVMATKGEIMRAREALRRAAGQGGEHV